MSTLQYLRTWSAKDWEEDAEDLGLLEFAMEIYGMQAEGGEILPPRTPCGSELVEGRVRIQNRCSGGSRNSCRGSMHVRVGAVGQREERLDEDVEAHPVHE